MKTQLEELTATYGQMCESSSSQLLQLERQLAQEEERKVEWPEGRKGERWRGRGGEGIEGGPPWGRGGRGGGGDWEWGGEGHGTTLKTDACLSC